MLGNEHTFSPFISPSLKYLIVGHSHDGIFIDDFSFTNDGHHQWTHFEDSHYEMS